MTTFVLLYNPSECPHCRQEMVCRELYFDHVSNDLRRMAREVGNYFMQAVFNPDTMDQITKAMDLVPHLKDGSEALKLNPARYKKYENDDVFGTYEKLLRFTKNLWDACERYPDAKIKIIGGHI